MRKNIASVFVSRIRDKVTQTMIVQNVEEPMRCAMYAEHKFRFLPFYIDTGGKASTNNKHVYTTIQPYLRAYRVFRLAFLFRRILYAYMLTASSYYYCYFN